LRLDHFFFALGIVYTGRTTRHENDAACVNVVVHYATAATDMALDFGEQTKRFDPVIGVDLTIKGKVVNITTKLLL
jgi:hypothetical protein